MDVRSGGRACQRQPAFPEFGSHGTAKLRRQGFVGDAIGGREEKAFQAGRGFIEVADRCRISGCFQERVGIHRIAAAKDSSDVESIAAFGDRNLLIEDFAFADLVEDLPRSSWRIEAILTGLESGARVEGTHKQESPAGPDNPLLSQQPGNSLRTGAALNIDKHLTVVRRVGTEIPSCPNASGEHA